MESLSPTITIAIILIVAGLLIWDQAKRKKGSSHSGSGGRSVLQTYTKDLSAEADKGNLDPVIGREEEIERVVHILSRRRKNNPLLLGEPGVGKTAIVEGLARRIHKGYVPDSIKDKRVLALDLTGMISGTKYRGEFEERMRHLTKEIEAMGRKIILFIDEIHMIEQASGAEGAMNVSDILKPALARGDLQAIGATTWKEYDQFIKPDDALNRRFQPVFVEEPSDDDSFEILRGIKGVYESFHHVQIPDQTLRTAIELSKEIQGRFLPDKALDLIDEASAKISIEAKFAHVDTAAEPAQIIETKERIKLEAKRLKEVIAELDALNEEFPDELEIEKAERALTRHLEQLTDHDKIIRNAQGIIVTNSAIQEVVDQWKMQT
ncbi:ATP-dependent Clp protease ATP-binding subunit [Candidatus Uhrbacteria bacterium]|nr:ATP-dependent Clp protease ATP-binding subunit [Candidatus Uhrbacteria bacterium]